MKKMLRQIIRSVTVFFDRIVVKEAERVFEFDSQVLGRQLKGGETANIKTNI